jgi:hypothetical protein
VNDPLKTLGIQGIISLHDKTVRRGESEYDVLFLSTSLKKVVKCLCIDELRGSLKKDDGEMFLVELDEGSVEYSMGSIIVSGTDITQISSIMEWFHSLKT